MSALKLQTLKQKLWAIVAASFVARVIMFFTLPSTPSSFAPDEGTYAALVKWIAEKKVADDFPTYGGGLYLSGRSVILPASWLYNLGVGELNAVRLVSTLHALLSMALIVFLICRMAEAHFSKFRMDNFNEKLIIAAFGVYAFLPSHFVWSTLGLRESPNEFWLILIYATVFGLYKTHQHFKLPLLLLLSTSIFLIFSTRPQVGWLTVISLMFFALSKLRTRITYLLLPAVLLGMLGGFATTTGIAYEIKDNYTAREIDPQTKSLVSPEGASQTQSEQDASEVCVKENSVVSIGQSSFECFKDGIRYERKDVKDPVTAVVKQIEVVPEKQSLNQIDAASVIKTPNCPFPSNNELSNYGCIVWRLPYMTSTFLFRPLPIVDTTSTASWAASIENVLWLLAFVILFVGLFVKRRTSLVPSLRAPIIFLILYIAGAGSYEGNMGTAFRHKSLVLWIVLLLLVAIFWRRNDIEERSI
jgi:hypothetical protein